METVYCFALDKETGEITRYEAIEVKTYVGSSRGCDVIRNGKKVRYYYKENQMGKYLNGKVFSYNPDYTVVRKTVLEALQDKMVQKEREFNMAREIYEVTKKNYGE